MTAASAGSAAPAASAASAALRQALTDCAEVGLSGVLRVAGDPGGAVHLRGGKIAAIETPGAPGPEVLLLRSHRMTETAWDSAFAATAAVGGRMSAELVARGLVGAGELEALLLTAVADAMFVLASGHVAECRAEPGTVDCLLELEPGADGDWMLGEAERRLRTLASFPFPPGQDRVAAAPGAVSPDVRLADGRDEILAMADGRRTPRDLAFALGRGVYATMLQLAAMREQGLLVTIPHRAAPPAGATRQPAEPGQPAEPAERAERAQLPHRNKDRPGPAALPRRAGQPGQWSRALPLPQGLLRPRVGRSADES